MKKALIAGAASTLALAAMPMAGVFAASGDNFTDVVTGNLAASCTMKSTYGTTPTVTNAAAGGATVDLAAGTLAAGTTTDIPGSKITVNCNDYANGWYVKAEGASTPGSVTGATLTSLVPQTNTSSSTPIATSATALDNGVSYWYMTVSSDDDSALLSNTFYENSAYKNVAIPGSEGATIMTGTKNTDAASTDEDGASFTATYHVYTSNAQQADTYKGAVKYTLVSPSN